MNWLYVLIFPSLLLAANPEIHWLRFHFPPSMFYLPGDSRDNSGFSDFSRNTMIQNTPEYRHVDYTESIHRAFKDAKENPDITLCFSGINKNAERESFLLYSSSFLKSFPNQLIVRTDNARIDRVLNADGTISLQRFLENGLTLSIAKSRSYSPVIDSLLQKFSKKNLIEPLTKDISHTYLLQVLHRRADATIAYPRNINYYATVEKSLNAEWFQSYPIAEHNEMIDVFFACSRHSQHSKELIAKINLLITENRKTFATEYAKWLSNDQKKLYGKRLKDTWPSP